MHKGRVATYGEHHGENGLMESFSTRHEAMDAELMSYLKDCTGGAGLEVPLGRQLRHVVNAPGYVETAAVDPAGAMLAYGCGGSNDDGSGQGTLVVVDLHTYRTLAECVLPSGICCVRFSGVAGVPELKVDVRISHAVRGPGVITAVDPDNTRGKPVSVRYDSGEVSTHAIPNLRLAAISCPVCRTIRTRSSPHPS
jgi:hypothetical protein